MDYTLTVNEAVALIERSDLPTVLTEGSTDYRVMRRVEMNLADLGINFLPLGGREIVLGVWHELTVNRGKSVIALVDLDCWIYFGIPLNYQGESILYTQGYSIENDIYMDSDLEKILYPDELARFRINLAKVCAIHAQEIDKMSRGGQGLLKRNAHTLVKSPDVANTLSSSEEAISGFLVKHYQQALRGKTLFELLSIELSRTGRKPNYSYDHLYDIGARLPGQTLEGLERELRQRLSN